MYVPRLAKVVNVLAIRQVKQMNCNYWVPYRLYSALVSIG